MNVIAYLIILCWAGPWPTLSATAPPITSVLGNVFRSGEITVAISATQFYYFEVPIFSSLPNGPVTLALSQVDYSQTLYSSNQIYFHLKEDNPTPSNNTHAVFRVFINYPTLTTRAKAKYMVCPTSIISGNFNIIVNQYTPGLTIDVNSTVEYAINDTLNTTGSWSFAIWISALQAYKTLGAYNIWTDFSTGSNRIRIGAHIDQLYVTKIRVTLIFFNIQANSVSGISPIYLKLFYPNTPSFSYPLNNYGGWFDTSNILCGARSYYFTSGSCDYIIFQSDRTAIASSPMSSPNQWAQIMCIVIGYKVCTSLTYYIENSDTCTDTCSTGTLINYTCLGCPSNCLRCNSTTYCLQCEQNCYRGVDNLCYICPSGTFPNKANYSCDLCLTGCTQCSSIFICSSCLAQYQFKNYSSGWSGSAAICQKCLLGWVVQGGCTKTYGCLEVTYNSPEAVLGTCTKCSSSFTLVSSTCECNGGNFLAGQYCTPIKGCIAAAFVSGSVVCQFCDVSGHFLLDHRTNTCSCQTYYSIQEQQCKQICGDGVVISLQCDDGNIENGDGCSSSCEVEPKYRCSTNNSLSPSICQFKSLVINISLESIKRTREDNQAIFTFTIDPNLLSLKYLNLNDLFSFSCDAVLGNILWEYKDGKITATVDFESDLEGKEAMVNFTFSQQYVSHDPIILNFTISTQTIKLIHYESQTIEQTKTFKTAFFGISCGALFLLFVGSWMHKMVGVELIHALQVVYYLHFTFKDYTLPLSSFQSLSLISLNDLYWQSQLQNFQGNSSFQKVPFSEDRTELTLFFLAIPAFLSLFGLTVYFLTYKYAEIETTESVLKIIRRIYNGVIFPVTMGFLFPYFFAKTTLEMTTASSSSSKFPMELISFISLLIFALTSVVLSYEVKNLFISIRSEEDKKAFLFSLAKQYYVPSYCLYSIAMVILLSVQICTGFSLSLIPIIAMSLLMILLLVKFRLYFKILDIVSTISNYFFEFGFIVTLYLRNSSVISSDKNTDLIICLGMAAFIIISILLSVARIILCLCSQNEEGESAKIDIWAPKIPKKKFEKTKRIDNQQNSIKEMMMNDCSKYLSNKQALPRNLEGCNNQNDSMNKKIPIDPQLQRKMNEVRKTFKRKTKIPSKMVREEREN